MEIKMAEILMGHMSIKEMSCMSSKEMSHMDHMEVGLRWTLVKMHLNHMGRIWLCQMDQSQDHESRNSSKSFKPMFKNGSMKKEGLD